MKGQLYHGLDLGMSIFTCYARETGTTINARTYKDGSLGKWITDGTMITSNIKSTHCHELPESLMQERDKEESNERGGINEGYKWRVTTSIIVAIDNRYS